MELRDQTILVASSEPWDFMPLSKHQVAMELARHNDVLFLNPPRGLRSRRVPLRRANTARVSVIDVFCPGFVGGRLLDVVLRRQLDHWRQPAVVIAFHPAFHHLRRVVPRAQLVYFANDAVHEPYLRDQAHMLRVADLVVAGSRTLQAALSTHRAGVAYVPLAVNVSVLERAPSARPSDLPPAPVAGLVGTIADQLDFPLLLEVVRARRGIAFPLIGPYDQRAHGGSGCPREWYRVLRAQPNVHFLGPRDHATIGSYWRHLDVALLPYAVERSRYKAPLKVLEAFVFGKPVVATRVPELERYQGLVHVADDASAFLTHLDQALVEHDGAMRERRRAHARAWTWTSVVERLSALLVREASVSP